MQQKHNRKIITIAIERKLHVSFYKNVTIHEKRRFCFPYIGTFRLLLLSSLSHYTTNLFVNIFLVLYPFFVRKILITKLPKYDTTFLHDYHTYDLVDHFIQVGAKCKFANLSIHITAFMKAFRVSLKHCVKDYNFKLAKQSINLDNVSKRVLFHQNFNKQ